MTNDTTSVKRFFHLVSHKKIIKNKEGALQSFFALHLNAYCTFKSYQKGLKPILAKRFYFYLLPVSDSVDFYWGGLKNTFCIFPVLLKQKVFSIVQLATNVLQNASAIYL